jgi:secreted trypsin-like serine protease
LITNDLIVTGLNFEKYTILDDKSIFNFLNFSAAHCIHNKGNETPINKNELLIMLGANNLSATDETGRQLHSVDEIIIHEKWNSNEARFNDDIALIRLSSEVTFNTFIQPICIIENDKNVSHGKVVGWGAVDDNESNNVASVAKIGELKFIGSLRCALYHYKLAPYAWEESFCGKSDDDGVCRGDSGSGFFVKIGKKEYLKGIVSNSVYENCSDKSVALYVDITKYLDFIKVRDITILESIDHNFNLFLI